MNEVIESDWKYFCLESGAKKSSASNDKCTGPGGSSKRFNRKLQFNLL